MLTWQTDTKIWHGQQASVFASFSPSASLCALLSQQQCSSVSLEQDILLGFHWAADGDRHKSLDPESAIFTIFSPLWPKVSLDTDNRRGTTPTLHPLKGTQASYMFFPALSAIIICFIENICKVLLFVREDFKVKTSSKAVPVTCRCHQIHPMPYLASRLLLVTSEEVNSIEDASFQFMFVFFFSRSLGAWISLQLWVLPHESLIIVLINLPINWTLQQIDWTAFPMYPKWVASGVTKAGLTQWVWINDLTN